MNTNNQAAAAQISPVETMLQMMSGFWVSRGIYVAAKLGISDHLHSGEKSAAELADLTDTNPDALYRVLRMLAMVGIYSQDEESRFSLTPLSELLLSDIPGSLRFGAIAEMGEIHYESWGNLMHSVKTGEIAFDNKFGMNVWEYFEQDREKAANFNKYMSNNAVQLNDAVSSGYDFSEAKTIVDVAGGFGGMISAVLLENPKLEGILFDAPSVIEGGKEFLAEKGLSERCETIGGDFFEAVPEGGDIYTMRWIIHDWDEKRSLKILENIRRVIPEHGKLLLVESIVPEDSQPHFSKFMDLIMLTMTGGRERTKKEYESLLKKAGFRVERIIETESFISIIEAWPV
ncbi:MAG: methyltransferase [Pyrinomonadaceae bacterium]